MKPCQNVLGVRGVLTHSVVLGMCVTLSKSLIMLIMIMRI